MLAKNMKIKIILVLMLSIISITSHGENIKYSIFKFSPNWQIGMFKLDDISITANSLSLEVVYKNKQFSIGQYHSGQGDSASLDEIELWELDFGKRYILVTTDSEWSKGLESDGSDSYFNTYYSIYLITDQIKTSLTLPKLLT